jgi:hypothetical protein
VDASFFVGVRSMTGWLGWVLVQCGEALVGTYVDYSVEDGIGFHSVVIIDLVISICFIVSVEPFKCTTAQEIIIYTHAT